MRRIRNPIFCGPWDNADFNQLAPNALAAMDVVEVEAHYYILIFAPGQGGDKPGPSKLFV
ncbi:hypothetical protein [Mesorhizobium sp.]|uniref:hypothetical protein n=1 Tax=Mesorhizobium sp. TaxID=1871066 RepID=UPI00121323E2|nr:hypothetical protein [Mesorhizobium sp.]TIO05590.1 MAG: hypothetical protein E5X88_26400 [Mesorhizobium sp.]TIO29474.1 MAG: hypothetical protein E5X89_31020 [Mesorhizobium sp.]TIP08813.1 MAG: hypothetical protein E5X73_30340 [Mesorhizobium sp.]